MDVNYIRHPHTTGTEKPAGLLAERSKHGLLLPWELLYMLEQNGHTYLCLCPGLTTLGSIRQREQRETREETCPACICQYLWKCFLFSWVRVTAEIKTHEKHRSEKVAQLHNFFFFSLSDMNSCLKSCIFITHRYKTTACFGRCLTASCLSLSKAFQITPVFSVASWTNQS